MARRLSSIAAHLGAGGQRPEENAAPAGAAPTKSIAEYGTSKHVDPLLAEFAKYDLFSHVVELEAYGMTVVPPEKMRWSPGFADRLRAAIVRTCEKRNGITIGDPATSQIRGKDAVKLAENSWDLLEEDDVFIEAATNPVEMALVRWLCGQSAVFGGQTWIIKRPSKPGSVTENLGLHSDSHGLPPGSGNIAHMCNASILCTDYAGGEDGPTVFVPGSHKFGRATLPHEGSGTGTGGFKTFPLIGKAGSLALWNGAVWHGGGQPRTKPGLRVTLVQTFFRTYMRPVVMYDRTLPSELLKKHPELARVVGTETALYPYQSRTSQVRGQKNNPVTIAPFMRTGTDPYA